MEKFDLLCEKINKKIKRDSKNLNEKSVKISNGFFDNQKANVALILVVAFVSFFMMFFMNTSTPYAAEDFDYHYIFADDGRKVTDERVDSIADIVTSMKVHYHTMNGRIVTHSIVQLIMMLDKKAVFNVANSLMYVAFTLLLYKHCIGKSKKQNALIFIFINLSIWFFIPQWGLTTVWLLGSVNYMWMSTVRLLYLLVFRLYAEDGEDKHTALKTIFMLVLGFASGNSSENMGAALVGVTVLFLIFYKIKKYKVRLWFITAFIGLMSGYCFMFFAPANSERIAKGGNSLVARLASIPANAVYYLAPLVCIGIIALVVIFNNNKERKTGISLIYFLGAVGGAAVMVAIPFFPGRAWFGIIIYVIMSVGILLNQLNLRDKLVIRQLVSVAVAFCCVWTLTDYLKAKQSADEYMDCWNERIEYMEEQRALGNTDLEFASMRLINKHAPMFSWTDIGTDDNDPQHISIAQYFDLNSVDWNGKNIIIE